MAAPTAAEMKKCFDKIDTDGGGTLSLEEVAQAMEMMHVDISPADLARTFARADEDNEGELDLKEFTQLVQRLEHGPIQPTPTDKRSEAAVALRKRRHRHSTSSRRLDTTTFRHQWTSAEDAKHAPRRTADRVVHRASWARQPEDWGGLRAGFEDTLVEPWDTKLDLPEWQRDMKPPVWLRRAKQRLLGAEDRRSKAKMRLRAISSQAVTLQRESETTTETLTAAKDLQQHHDRHYIDSDDYSIADPSLSQLRRNHVEQLRRVDAAQSVEHFLYYLPADQAERFGHLRDQLVDSRPSTAGNPLSRSAQLSTLSATSRRSGSRSCSREECRSRGSNATEHRAPLSFARLRSMAHETPIHAMDSSTNDLDKWGGWADEIYAVQDQELRRAKRAAEKEEAASAAREQAAQHAAIMANLQKAVKDLHEAKLTIERYRKALGKRVGWTELLESLREQDSREQSNSGSNVELSQDVPSSVQNDDSKNQGENEDQDNKRLVEQAARRARLVRRKKLAARANIQALKLSEQEVTARAAVARANVLQNKTALAFVKRDIDLERRHASRAAAGIEIADLSSHRGEIGDLCGERSKHSQDSVRLLEKAMKDAGTSLALEEYSLLALKDEQANLKMLLHEVDATLPLTTRRSGLSQAKPQQKAAKTSSLVRVDALNRCDADETAANLLSKAEVAANQLDSLQQRVAQCRNSALRSLAARLRRTEEELALRTGNKEGA